MIQKKEYQDCIAYLRGFWPQLTFYLPKSKLLRIGLPNKFISPSNSLFEGDQFYWDTYFIILGLVADNKIALAKGMVDNLAYLSKKFGIIPLRNRLYNLGISQPPFLTSMTLEVYNAKKDTTWLKKSAQAAELELQNYWLDNAHNYFDGLSRYCDHFWIHSASEHESGWDMTSRFNDECLNYLPIDLNCCLYKYETDLSKMYGILGDKKKEREFLKKSSERKEKIQKLMWNEEKGFFFDYNAERQQQSSFYSLAGFYALWAEVATPEQAKKMAESIKKFEYRGGLANTQKNGLSEIAKQWDYPNGWANQQFIVVEGLMHYGYQEQAEGLAKKWLDLNKKVFMDTGKFWERYDVVNYNHGQEGRYPIQTGFGWTNAVFLRFIKEFAR